MYTDEELTKRAAGLREEQDRWNDLFATKLIEVLDKIDSIRAEVNEGVQQTQKIRPILSDLELSVSRAKRESELIERTHKLLQGHLDKQSDLTAAFTALLGNAEFAKDDLLSSKNVLVEARDSLVEAEQLHKRATAESREANARLIKAEKSAFKLQEGQIRSEGLLQKAQAQLNTSSSKLELAHCREQAAERQYYRLLALFKKGAIVFALTLVFLLVASGYDAWLRSGGWLVSGIIAAALAVPVAAIAFLRKLA